MTSEARRNWTLAELAELRRRYATELTADIALAVGWPVASVHRQASRMGLRKSKAFIAEIARERTTRPGHGSHAVHFKPGNVPWNKGRPGLTGHHPNTVLTHFTAGVLNGRAAKLWQPLGTLRINNGALERKVTNTPGAPNKRWHAVHRLVWEAEHGPVPAGHIVVFKAGRKTTELDQITLDRLELVSRAENMRRNSVHSKYPPELARLVQLRGALNRAINRKAKEAETT